MDAGDFTVTIPAARRATYVDYVGDTVTFGIRPEDLHDPHFVPPGVHQSVIEAKVDVIELMGNEIFVYLKVGGQDIIARVDPRTNFRVGDSVQVAINMDGRARLLDNIFIERLWRSLKYEEIYLKNHDTVPQRYDGLRHYFHFYNMERPHQALDNRRPLEVYLDGQIHPN